jgi:hypothetical protein
VLISNYIYLNKTVVKEETDKPGADAAVAFNLLLHNVPHDFLRAFASLVVVSVVEPRGSRRTALFGRRQWVGIPVARLACVSDATKKC